MLFSVVFLLILEVISILNIVSLYHQIIDNSNAISKIESNISDSICDATQVIIQYLSIFTIEIAILNNNFCKIKSINATN